MTQHNPNESIIITLETFANACFNHYMMGFNQAQGNLQVIGQGLVKGEGEIKGNIIKCFCEERDKVAVLNGNIKQEAGEIPEVEKKENEQ